LPATRNYLALDLGASHGRAVLGRLAGGRLEVRRVHDFENTPIAVGGRRCWDTEALFGEILTALKLAADMSGSRLDGVAVDSWGLDFCLFDGRRRLLSPPTSYRDGSDRERREEIVAQLGRLAYYEKTGVQLSAMHGAPRLAVALERDRGPARRAELMLHMAGSLALWLCGRPSAEHSMLGGCGWCEAVSGRLWGGLLDRLGIPGRLFPETLAAGSVLGELLPGIREETGLGPVPVLVPAAHDTANLAAAIPARGGETFAFLSSGTWGLVGLLSERPLLSRKSFEAGVTNFPVPGGGFMNAAMFTNLWIIQECRRCWCSEGRDLSYDRIVELALQAEPMTAIVDPDDSSFAAPEDMSLAVQEFCRRTGQPAPEGAGQTARVVFESLARRCRDALARLESVGGRRAEVLYVAGGGVRNALLNQLIADATGIPVATAPAEATAVGNMMIQAMGSGEVGSLAAAREIVRHSFVPARLQPGDPERREQHRGDRV